MAIFDYRGDVGYGPLALDQFTKDWRAFEKKNTYGDIAIASAGGLFFDGIGTANVVRQSKVKTRALVEFAMSAATAVALAADKVCIYADGFWLVHSARLLVDGTAKDHAAAADTADKADQWLLDVYCAKTGKSRVDMFALMQSEALLTATQAKAWGFVDEVLAVQSGMTAVAASTRFQAVKAQAAKIQPVWDRAALQKLANNTRAIFDKQIVAIRKEFGPHATHGRVMAELDRRFPELRQTLIDTANMLANCQR